MAWLLGGWMLSSLPAIECTLAQQAERYQSDIVLMEETCRDPGKQGEVWQDRDYLTGVRRTSQRLMAFGSGEEEPGGAPIPSTLDVMILYTTAARERYGEAEIHSRNARSIAYLNEAFKRSGVHGRVRLVYQGEVTWHEEYKEAIQELYWLAGDATVSKLRAEFGADLVALFARHAEPTGGMGQLPGTFSVFNGNPFVFAHEIGHNLGCAHDRAHAEDWCDPDASNYGYSFTPPGSFAVYGDLMSYVGSQIEQFSNPDRFFMGVPTGLPEGHLSADGTPDSADNAAVLNQSIPYRALSNPTRAPSLIGAEFSPDGGQFVLRIAGPDEVTCTIDYTRDRVTWNHLTDCTLSSASIEVVDPAAVDSVRFYRARFAGEWLPVHAGYVKKTVPAGFSMLANPLENLGNDLATLLPEAPEGVQIYKWMEGRHRWQCNTFTLGAWDDPAMTLHPGEGIVIHNASGAPWTICFVGEPNQTLHNRVPLEHSIRSSAIPEAGSLSDVLGCRPFGPGVQLFRMTSPSGSYTAYTWDGESWSPEEPALEIGEAFWCRNTLNAFIWERVLECSGR